MIRQTTIDLARFVRDCQAGKRDPAWVECTKRELCDAEALRVRLAERGL